MNATQLSHVTDTIRVLLEDVDYEINPNSLATVAHVYIEGDGITALIRDGHALNADLYVNLAYDAEYLRECLDSIVEDAWRNKQAAA